MLGFSDAKVAEERITKEVLAYLEKIEPGVTQL